jgi:hypothetical protein
MVPDNEDPFSVDALTNWSILHGAALTELSAFRADLKKILITPRRDLGS